MSHSVEILLSALIGGSVFVGVVAIIGGFMHSRRNRLLIHTERMKALEMGREMPEDPASAKARAEAEASEETTYAGKCYKTTLYVGFWGFLFAVGASSKEAGNSPGAAYAVAAATGAIGVTGLICGTVLASKASQNDPRLKSRYEHQEV